jgi:hypothetical protein
VKLRYEMKLNVKKTVLENEYQGKQTDGILTASRATLLEQVNEMSLGTLTDCV